MAAYEYRCPAGHETLLVAGMSEEKPQHTRCSCGLKASRVPPQFQLTPDICEDFNTSIGAPVRSRRHLRDLQQRGGFRDYERVTPASAMQERAEIAADRRARAAEKRKGFRRLERPAEREWESA